MDATVIAETQAAIVRAVAGNVTDVMDGEWGMREWCHLFVDFEAEPDGGRTSSITFAIARLPGQQPEKISFRLPPEAKRLFVELADAMQKDGTQRWSTAQLRVERDGRHDFQFAYDPPYRLGGNLLDKRFEDYLDTWLASPDGQGYREDRAADEPVAAPVPRWRSLFR